MSAMDEALATIARQGEEARARRERNASDPRVVALKARNSRPLHRHGMAGARQVFLGMADGSIARQARVGSLVRARIGQLDGNRAAVRVNLRHAAQTRQAEVSKEVFGAVLGLGGMTILSTGGV